MDRRALFGGTPMRPSRSASQGADFYANAELVTQHGRKVRFYDDLIKDRIVRSWDRRARERKMMYDLPFLNGIVFMEQIATTLNQCNERVRVKKLNWNANDPITGKHNTPTTAFHYVRDLRKDNDSLHLRNKEFQERMGSSCAGNCRAPASVAPTTKLSAATR